MIRSEKLGRISSAFMHARTRFCVCAMQSLGHPANAVDDALVKDLREAYAKLLRLHLEETLIVPEA